MNSPVNHYDTLRNWYLARLRRLAAEAEQLTDCTPASFIAVDKERIKQLAGIKNESTSQQAERFISPWIFWFIWLLLQVIAVAYVSTETADFSQAGKLYFSSVIGPLLRQETSFSTSSELVAFFSFYITPLLVLALIPVRLMPVIFLFPKALNDMLSALKIEEKVFPSGIALLLLLVCARTFEMGQLCLNGSNDSCTPVLMDIIACFSLLSFATLAKLRQTRFQLLQTQARCKRMNTQLSESNKDKIDDLEANLSSLEKNLSELILRERAIADFSETVLLSLTEDLSVDSLSPNVKLLWGYSDLELNGKSFSEILFSEDINSFKDAVESCKKSKSERLVCRVRKRDNSIFDCSFYLDWSPAFQRIFATAEDVSTEKNLERVKQDFIAKLTHDMRSPLGSVKLTLSAFSENCFGELPAAATRVIQRAQSGLSRVLLLIDEILDAEKLSSGDLSLDLDEQKIHSIASLVVDEFKAQAEQKQIELSLNHSDLRVVADANLIVRVLSNLLSNAISFTPEQGNIAIEIWPSDNYALLKVTDCGPGVPPEYQELIFERFATLDTMKSSKRKSSGLGLNICKEIIKAHGGKIGVESKPGAGSTFWFTLPMVKRTET